MLRSRLVVSALYTLLVLLSILIYLRCDVECLTEDLRLYRCKIGHLLI